MVANSVEADYAEPTTTVEGKADEFRRWREQLTIDDFKEICHTRDSSKFTIAVMCSGGLICTQAAVRAGFQPIWGTEICPHHPDIDGVCSCGNNDR